jgi:hypothetical protein
VGSTERQFTVVLHDGQAESILLDNKWGRCGFRLECAEWSYKCQDMCWQIA